MRIKISKLMINNSTFNLYDLSCKEIQTITRVWEENKTSQLKETIYHFCGVTKNKDKSQ